MVQAFYTKNCSVSNQQCMLWVCLARDYEPNILGFGA